MSGVAQTEEVTGRMKRGSGGLVRTQKLSRVFNLLDIACKLVAVYCGMGAHGPPTALLSCHPNSLRCAFTVSQFLRELCDQFVVEFNQNGVSWVADDSNLKKQPARIIRISDLLHSQSKQMEYLNANILKVTDAEFKSRSGIDVQETRCTAMNSLASVGQQISVNEADKVFNIT